MKRVKTEPKEVLKAPEIFKEPSISPSRLGMLDLCAGYISSPFGDKAAAEEGTMLHEVVETERIPAALTPDQIDMVEYAMEWKRTLSVQFAVVLHEVQLVMPHCHRGGFADLVVYDQKAKLITVCDWKFGRARVDEAKENLQLKAYALGVLHHFEVTKKVNVEGFKVRVGIVYPRLEDVSFHTFEQPEVRAFKEHMDQQDAKCKDWENHMATNTYCGWCARASVCPLNLAKVNGIGLTQVPSELKPEDLTAEMLRELRDAMSEMETWAKAVKNLTNKAMKEGMEIPTYRKVSRKGKPSINVSSGLPELIDFFKEWTPKADMLAYSSLSMTSLTKMIKENAPDIPGATEALKNLIDSEPDWYSRNAEIHFLQKEKIKK